MKKVRLLSTGMESFSSYLGTVKFVNGVSEDTPSQAEIARLGALTKIEVFDEETGEAEQGGAGADAVKHRTTGAPMNKHFERGVADAPKEEINPTPVEIKEAAKPVEDTDKAQAELDALLAETSSEPEGENHPVRFYTKEELEAVADEKGIAGLREIADPMGVKNTSIVGLINEILQAQGAQ